MRRKRIVIVLCVLMLGGTIWWISRERVSHTARHPLFGVIHSSEMTEEEYEARTRTEIVSDTLRDWLRLSRRAVPPRWLKVGPTTLEWSAGNWIYMREISTNAHAPLWEFALCDGKTLADVTREDLRRDFYGIDDPRGTNVFGTNWGDYAIRVPAHQTFLARLATNQSMVYAVQLGTEQRLPASTRQWGRMRIQYVRITE